MTEDEHAATPASALSDVVAGLSRLIRGEIELAKAEAARAFQDMATAGTELVIALVVALTAVFLLAQAGVYGLIALGLHPALAALGLGVALLLVALGLVQHARVLWRDTLQASLRSGQNLAEDLATLQNTGKTDG